MSIAEQLTAEFLTYARTRLDDCLQQIERCLGLLSVEQIWHRPNDVSNAIGNLVIHLDGNVRQWILGGLGEEPVERDRAAEFAQRDPLPTDEVLANLSQTVARAQEIIADLGPEELIRQRQIQGYETTGLSRVFHVVEHFSLHTGQIVYATKILTGLDLSLYDARGRRIDGRTQGGAP